MFRRKKSATDVAQRGTAAISISGPMRIAAQAPLPPFSSPAAAAPPLYERFAKTTHGTANVGVAGPTRRSASNARARSSVADGNDGLVGRPEKEQQSVGRTGGSSSRLDGRVGLAISPPSREEGPRVTKHQQLSPPTSPTFPRSNVTSNVSRRPMPDVHAHALDDLPPPTRLLSKSNRTLPQREVINAPRVGMKMEREDTQLSKIITPPSPPQTNSTLSTSDTPVRSTVLPPSSRTPLRSTPAAPPPPSSFASPSPAFSRVDESGALPGSTSIKGSPTLGNSLEARQGPRRAKYSPLAAFGPSGSVSTSTGSSSFMPSSQDTPPPPPPPQPRNPGISPTLPTISVESTQSHYQPNADPIADPSAGRPSVDSFSYSDRHASLQPLKTASVQLRVGLAADELQTFHSPLFGNGFGGRSSEEHVQNDDNKSITRAKRDSRFIGEPSSINQSEKDGSAILPLSGRTPLHGVDADAGREGGEEKQYIKTRGKGRSGRMATQASQASPANMEMEMPPTPPSPSAPAPTMLDDPVKEIGENGHTRNRSTSVSSAGSMRRKATVYAKQADSDVPNVPAVHQDQPRTPRTAMRSQIPTPPTSVDGHSNDQSQRLTIASVLDGENSPEVSSPSSLESRRVRKTSSSRRIVADLPSSLPSANVTTTGHARPGEAQADVIATSEMTGRTTLPPSIAPSSSSSSADAVVFSNETQSRPMPRLHTQDLPALGSYPPPHFNQHSQQQHAPLSPPQSPPQSGAPALSSSQSRSRARSKSRSRSNRPGTGSSAHSLNYIPPSSASSSDGLGRSSPSALSILNPFSSSSSTNGSVHTTRKLTKTPPHSVRSLTEGASTSAAEQYRRQITESPEQTDMLVDADPFAKGEIVRALPAGESAASISGVSLTPPVPPFAHAQGSGGSGPPSPASPNDYFSARVNRRGERLDTRPREAAQALANKHEGMEDEETPQAMVNGSAADANGQIVLEPEPEPEAEPEEPTFYPLEKHLMHVDLLGALLPHLAFRDWCALNAINDAMRRAVEHKRELREIVLEHFLRTVGYARWRWSTKEHIMLTFRDLNSYMRGVSIPSHQYAVYAKAFLDAKQQVQNNPADDYLKFNLKTASAQKSLLASSCRAYTRVVMRLRAQAEAMERDAEGDAPVYQFTPPQSTTSVNTKSHVHHVHMQGRRSVSRVRVGTPSRPASPTMSTVSHSHHGHYRNGSSNGNGHSKVNRYERAALAGLGPRFRSPLFRLGHAPCLRVCVPSPEGQWLSDASVLECEKELKRAGVVPLLRVGDVIWDAAVGDEGNVGRMVWDGNYLIDLDYTYSRLGEVPQYLHTLSFPPSYFHRVIRTPGNPICRIDISPWGEEIAANLQLLQDRIKTETPQGGHHMVVRWIHRSKFRVRPNPYTNAPIAIPGTSLSVDPGWYGTIIIEIEGTNEGLADLQQRCRSGFPPRAVGAAAGGRCENGDHAMKAKPPSKEFRLLRERSRPGEIWLRAVREKERVL